MDLVSEKAFLHKSLYFPVKVTSDQDQTIPPLKYSVWVSHHLLHHNHSLHTHAPFYTPYFLSRHAVMTISKHTNLSISRLLSGNKRTGYKLDNWQLQNDGFRIKRWVGSAFGRLLAIECRVAWQETHDPSVYGHKTTWRQVCYNFLHAIRVTWPQEIFFVQILFYLRPFFHKDFL